MPRRIQREGRMRRSIFLVLGAALAAGPNPSAVDLPFFYDLYTFRGRPGVTRVVAAFAVEAGRLKREWESRGVRYRFDVSLVLADTAQQTVYRSDDSVYAAVPERLGRNHLLYTQVELEAPASRSTLARVTMMDAGRAGVGELYAVPFAVPDYSGEDFMISDVAMGVPGATQGWRRGDVTLALLPTQQFPGGSFDLYYELYNAVRGGLYTTDISIEHLGAKGRRRGEEAEVVHTRFTEEARTDPSGTVAALRFVRASLRPGHYLLTVKVTDETTGAWVARSRPFQVRRGARNATMVPALPAGKGAGGVPLNPEIGEAQRISRREVPASGGDKGRGRPQHDGVGQTAQTWHAVLRPDGPLRKLRNQPRSSFFKKSLAKRPSVVPKKRWVTSVRMNSCGQAKL